MPTATTSRNVSLPISHELSSLASPREPDSTQRLHRKANVNLLQAHSDKQAIDQLARMVEKIRRRILGGGVGTSNGWVWQEPNKELDPTLDVPKYTFVYITENNDIVVTGLTDLVSDTNVKACEGFWQANDDIPAKDGDGKYHVPQHPYPSATGTPTGSPGAVIGDLDALGEDGKPAVKWIYWGQVACAGV